jgi:hypothetical protein
MIGPYNSSSSSRQVLPDWLHRCMKAGLTRLLLLVLLTPLQLLLRVAAVQQLRMHSNTANSAQCHVIAAAAAAAAVAVDGCQPPAGAPCDGCDITANPGAVGGSCTDDPAPGPGFSCTCPTGRTWDGATKCCKDTDECVGDPCSADTLSNGTCIDAAAPNTGYSCACKPGAMWTSSGCASTCTCCMQTWICRHAAHARAAHV